jgi:hypothetical protein
MTKGTPIGVPFVLSHGGAGIRTPVRKQIHHSVYVRIPPISVSSRWPVDSPLLNKPSKISSTGGGRADATIQNLRYLISRLWRASYQAGAATPKSYAARAKLLLAVKNVPAYLTRTRMTWARSHSFTNSVEASRPRTRILVDRSAQVNSFAVMKPL